VRAYVTKGQLVGYFDQLVLHVSSPEDPKKIDIKLREAWVTAKIVADATGHRLTTGVGGGRWATADLLKEVRSIYVKETGPFKNFFVCDNTGKLFYDAVKDKVCKARDIRTASRDDNTGRPCDAFSVGIQFDSYRVDTLGDFENGADAGTRCVDAAVPEGDECP